MYLIARPPKQAKLLLELLTDNQIDAQILPIMDIKVDQYILANINNRINACGGVLFTSPTVIDCMQCKLADLNFECKFYAVGKSTAKYLKMHSRRAVYYPKLGSGNAALINENILSQHKLAKLAIIGADRLDLSLAEYLTKAKISFDFIELYQRVNVGITNADLTIKILSQAEITGIIITSKLIAAYLADCVNELGLFDQLNKMVLISIHPQITNFLHQYGFSQVRETLSADNEAILTLLRNLEYERKC